MGKNNLWRHISGFDGLLLVYIGAGLLVLHCILSISSNFLLCFAIVLELIGIVSHYKKITR